MIPIFKSGIISIDIVKSLIIRMSTLFLLFSVAYLGIGFFADACLPYGKSNRVQIGFPTYVCLTIGPFQWLTNSTFLRIASEMKADELGSIDVKGCTHFFL